jgi:N-acetylmuramoyl-L-alanine amidase
MKHFRFDPGHGGTDPGAVGHGLHEADVVLDLATKTGNYILRNYEGVKISYSRTSDVFVSLDQRTDMANKDDVDFLFSFHDNSHSNLNANGFETFVYNDASSASIAYQNVIHGEIMQYLKKYNIYDRGKKRGNLHMVRETKMPAVLAEYLFISNKKENELLKNESFINGLAEATGKGIAKATGLKEKVAPVIKAVAKRQVRLVIETNNVNAEKIANEFKERGYPVRIEEM